MFGTSFSVIVSKTPSEFPFVDPDCDNSITSTLLPPLWTFVRRSDAFPTSKVIFTPLASANGLIISLSTISWLRPNVETTSSPEPFELFPPADVVSFFDRWLGYHTFVTKKNKKKRKQQRRNRVTELF